VDGEASPRSGHANGFLRRSDLPLSGRGLADARICRRECVAKELLGTPLELTMMTAHHEISPSVNVRSGPLRLKTGTAHPDLPRCSRDRADVAQHRSLHFHAVGRMRMRLQAARSPTAGTVDFGALPTSIARHGPMWRGFGLRLGRPVRMGGSRAARGLGRMQPGSQRIL
jgi:hypothetical protein